MFAFIRDERKYTDMDGIGVIVHMVCLRVWLLMGVTSKKISPSSLATDALAIPTTFPTHSNTACSTIRAVEVLLMMMMRRIRIMLIMITMIIMIIMIIKITMI